MGFFEREWSYYASTNLVSALVKLQAAGRVLAEAHSSMEKYLDEGGTTYLDTGDELLNGESPRDFFLSRLERVRMALTVVHGDVSDLEHIGILSGPVKMIAERMSARWKAVTGGHYLFVPEGKAPRYGAER